MKNRIQKFFKRERDEIKKNKKRFVSIAVIFVAAILFFVNNGNDEVKVKIKNEPPKIVEMKKEIDKKENDSKLTKIAGLEKASKNVELINPFKVDIELPQKSAESPYVCIGVQASMTAKGWLYPHGWDIVVDYLKSLGYRVLCIDKNKSESHMLKLGDEINGKKIIDIGRNFIIFDDGEYLYLQGGE